MNNNKIIQVVMVDNKIDNIEIYNSKNYEEKFYI